jgi:NAD(P)-dependent dehydrogenase (short-subunit alcohol dehydrogenase family)
MVVARTARELQALADETGCAWIAASLDSPDACRLVVAETERILGPIDLLVNNAGVGAWGETPIWERRYGRIVMVSSTAGAVGGPSQPAYCASKHGLVGLARAVAQDLGPHGVTCNAVLPGWVRTRMAEEDVALEAARTGRTPQEVWAEHAAAYPAGRVLEPDEVASTIRFLLDDAASGVNGEAVTVALGGRW